ncbi:hypothetical protein cypCar_00042785, partial [Cyprinus carpio]
MQFQKVLQNPPDPPFNAFSTVRSQVERMAARVSCSLMAVLLCLAKGPVTGAVDLEKTVLLPS